MTSSFIIDWAVNWLIGWGGAGLIVSIVAWALWLFTPALLIGLKSMVLQVAVAATVFTLSSTYFYSDGYSTGYAVAIGDVAKKDEAAIERVKEGEGDVANCRAGDGEWDVVTGTCQ